ncbi:acetolactate decarboxylase [Capnocytophaga sp. ARDL2]|uniref:acetolactate decarboxylase n=1 Tax=Capnocytophaga sp. ARDL2 TaxID=3238809 RepID=UPI00355665D1
MDTHKTLIFFNKNTNQIAVCSNGKTLGEGSVYLSTNNGDFVELPNIANGFFDGVEWLDDSTLLISDWVTYPTKGFGKIWKYDLKNQQSILYLTEEGIADIYFDSKTKKIFMPQMLKNRVIITDLEKLQTEKHEKHNRLYQYGIADGFVNGLYRGTLPIGEIKFKGDFGLGAPDMLYGELTMLDGRIYQTKATGQTIEPEDDFKTSILFTTFFKADTFFNVDKSIQEKALWALISEKLQHKNGIYAIKITGKFDFVKTRAFPPVKSEPFPVITELFDTQNFFEFTKTEGTLIGFYMPEFLNGINSKGYHFHFLSKDKKQGGHLLDFVGNNLKIEISELQGIDIDIPKDADFQNFKFQTKDNEILKRVEQGK